MDLLLPWLRLVDVLQQLIDFLVCDFEIIGDIIIDQYERIFEI
jgi:hypothetical protein